MKYILSIILVLVIFSARTAAQSVSINNDGSSPDASAILDLKSSDKGLLLPRLTNAQRDNINSPVAGLIIYNSDTGKYQVYNGSVWQDLAVNSCVPSQPGVISGILYPECSETGVSYSISSVPNATYYRWTVPPGASVATGQGTTNITVDFASLGGNISVRAESGCGNSPYRDLGVSIAIPDAPGAISGNAYPDCSSSGEVYSISAVNGARNYTWQVPAGASIVSGQGTTSITVSYTSSTTGNISVRAENACGNSAYTDFPVTVAIPAAPGAISGDDTPLCSENNIGYSIASVNGATSYNWTVPSGASIASGQATTSINVNFGTQSGNVSVRAENACGNSSYTDFAVDVGSLAQPGAITGDDTPLCSENNTAYSITAVNDASSYNWTVPSGASITSGQATTSITVDFGTQSGNVSVRAENACDNSDYTNLAVDVGSLAQPGAITGNEYVDCNASGEVYSITAVNDASSYGWQVPAGATITSGSTTSSITVDFGTQSGNVSVRAENACDNSNYTDLAVSTIPEQPGSITGDNEVCLNETGVTYSITPISNATSYEWQVPAGATITSGSTTTSITVDFGTQSGNVSVRAVNACGNSAYTDLAVDAVLHIGCYYAGGVVFYIDGSGQHGLVCAVSDQSTGAEWGCYGTTISGADGTAIGTGNQNTIDIEAGCTTAGTAADICANLTLNGYSDWFLPSKDELNVMYQNKADINATAIANGGSAFADDYWSSSEFDYDFAWMHNFGGGNQSQYPKNYGSNKVRAVRAF